MSVGMIALAQTLAAKGEGTGGGGDPPEKKWVD